MREIAEKEREKEVQEAEEKGRVTEKAEITGQKTGTDEIESKK